MISNKQIVESPSSGNERISPSKFLAKTVLPAPINVIFLDELLIVLLYHPLRVKKVDDSIAKVYNLAATGGRAILPPDRV